MPSAALGIFFAIRVSARIPTCTRLDIAFGPGAVKRRSLGGPAILQYIKDTAREFGIDKKIRFQHRVSRVSWSSADAEWTVEIERDNGAETAQFRCKFLFMCTGYYRYDQGYTPRWDGTERFEGAIIHPQDWREDLDYAGKHIIVIGSGATAVTLVPALAERAAHVTMLQRSPSYVVSVPAKDKTSLWLHEHLPTGLASWLARWRLILRSMYFFHLARSNPEETRAAILANARAALGSNMMSNTTSARATIPGVSAFV